MKQEFLDVPAEVVAAAEKVAGYFAERDVRSWQLAGLQARDHVRGPRVRYCPECGSVGEVESSAIACCPDSSPIHLPAIVAEQARAGFIAGLPQRDVAGEPKLRLTVLESLALSACNEVKAWCDSDRTTPFPESAHMNADAVLMFAAQRRQGVA